MKKRTQKIVSMLAVAAMAVSLFAGCGGGNGAANNTANNNANTADTRQTQQEAPSTESTLPETQQTQQEAADPNSTPREETLYFAGQQWGTINDYNPLSANSNNSMAIVGNPAGSRTIMYETLFMMNPLDGKLYGLLGSEYAWNDDMTVCTVKMNPDAKWSDGTAVTADDVAYTYDTHVKYQTSGGVDNPNYIESITAVDPATVEIKCKVADGKAVNPLKIEDFLSATYILQKAYIQTVEERCGEDAEKMKTDRMDDAVYSGPYGPMVANDQKVVFVRNDSYWGQAASMWGKLPVPKYIAHVIYKDNAAGQVALAAGEVDVCQQFLTDVQNMWLQENLPISTWLDEAPYGLCVCMPSMFFNTEKPGLDRKEVRRAIAIAVDYEQIIASAMSGQSPTFEQYPRSVMAPVEGEQAMINWDDLADVAFTGNDVEGAKKLLDDAGIIDTDGDGIREIDGTNLSYKAECPEGWTDWNASMEIVAAAGKNIGIDIQTYFPDANTFYDDMTNRKFDICMWSSPGVQPSGSWARAMFYMSGTYAAIQQANWSGNFGGYTNERADEILAAIPTETHEAKLKEYYTELSRILLEDCPAVALMYRPQLFYAVNESVWTNYPAADDGRNIPPTDCTDGYGIAALYELSLVQ